MSQQKFEQPLCILIAALGGEGGGRLMNWLVASDICTGSRTAHRLD